MFYFNTQLNLKRLIKLDQFYILMQVPMALVHKFDQSEFSDPLKVKKSVLDSTSYWLLNFNNRKENFVSALLTTNRLHCFVYLKQIIVSIKMAQLYC